MFKKADIPKPDMPKKKRGKKFWLILISILIILALVAFFIIRPLIKKNQAGTQMTATVTRGTITRSIEGSGVIEPIDQYTISSLVTGEVLSDTFEEGDMVNEGDLLYVIDSANLDSNIERAESSVETARLSYEESMETLENQTVKAPISGIITSLSVKEGDEITNGTRVAEITNSSRMLLTLYFLDVDAQSIFPGDTALVVPENTPGQSLSGSVKSVSSGAVTNSLGVAVRTVEILVDNPGGIQNGSRATATVGTYACNEIGTFSYEETKTVSVKTGGTVTGLSIMNGDKIAAGDVLFTLTSASTARSIERSRISYNDAVTSRDNAYEQLEDYQITAPISGKVTEKNVKAGDKLENGSGSNASSMAIIADLSILTFEMSVDELDISDIKEGQEVQITADAVEGRLFTGYVKTVGLNGVSSNGVTSYPVTVELDGEENAELRPGFNVNATIVIESRENVLLIPTSAVSRGNMVAVKGDAPKAEAQSAPENTQIPPPTSDADAEKARTEDTVPANGRPAMPQGDMPEGNPPKNPSQNKSTETESDAMRVQNKAASRAANMEAPEGFHYVRIETGITDGKYIEVISGLSEGDVILLPQTVGDANSAVNYTRQAQSGMMGGMGGGMPMGGGMSGGNRGGMSGGMPGR